MVILPKEKRAFTLEEYLELERASERKFEFFDGNVWSRESDAPAHEIIVGNLIRQLNNRFEWHSCRVFPANQKIKVPLCPPYRYPDLTALYGEPVYEESYGVKMLVNPQLIVEVFSPATEAFDRSDRFTCYKSIENFTEYLLISHDRPHITLFNKQDENAWLHREYNSLNESVYLSSVDCEMPISEIYLDVGVADSNYVRAPF